MITMYQPKHLENREVFKGKHSLTKQHNYILRNTGINLSEHWDKLAQLLILLPSRGGTACGGQAHEDLEVVLEK